MYQILAFYICRYFSFVLQEQFHLNRFQIGCDKKKVIQIGFPKSKQNLN